MSSKRRQFSEELEAKVGLEALRGERVDVDLSRGRTVMDFGNFLTSLLNGIGSGEPRMQFGIAPVNLGGIHLYRFDNLTVVMSPPRAGREESPETTAMVVPGTVSRRASGPAIETPDVPAAPSRASVAAPYRLEPLLAFDVQPSGDDPGEFEVAPRIRAAIVPDPDATMNLSQFDAARRTRNVRFVDGTPVRIQRGTDGEWIEFDGRRQARLGRSEFWSCRRFPIGKPVRLPAGGSGSIAVLVDKSVWAASWLLTRKDPQRRIRDSSFLILIRA